MPSYYWADRLRNLATLMVIIIHVAAPVVESTQNYEGSVWQVGNLWNAFSRPAVPLFVMLSGFLLLAKDYPLPDFLKRRFSRVVIPSVVWMIFYMIYNHFANNHPNSLPEALKELATGPVHYHLWFIYLIIGLYLMYPIIRPWVRQAQDRDFIYALVLCAIGTWVHKFMYAFLGYTIGVQLELFTNHFGYFILGYYLGHKVPAGEQPLSPNIQPWRLNRGQLVWLSAALILAGGLLTAGLSYWGCVFYNNRSFYALFYDYLTANVTIEAVGLFMFAQLLLNSRPTVWLERELAACSFGIYLGHVFMLDGLARLGIWYGRAHPAITVPGIAGLVIVLTFMLVKLIRLLPGGKRIT